MALGGRWGRSEDDDDGDEVEGDSSAASEADAGVEAVESQVVEPSEVRTESDPWSD